MAISEIPLLDRETILRRIGHLRKPPNVRVMNEVTIRDMARWIGVKRETVKLHTTGKEPISDSWQIIYSRFFHMLDEGRLKIVIVGEGRFRKKELVLVPKPDAPTKRPIRPHIEFFGGHGLRMRFT